MKKIFLFSFIILQTWLACSQSHHSVARQWNEQVLEAIRNDFARPTAHARNLFHHSVLMYDIWAVYDSLAEPYFLGQTHGDYQCLLDSIIIPTTATERKAATEEAISYAMYRMINYRFRFSPGYFTIKDNIDALMQTLGYDERNALTNYAETQSPAALGNYAALCMIEYGRQDGSNEINDYINTYYEPVNPPLVLAHPGNPAILDPNRWQPLTLDVFIDQGGNPIPFNTPEFLSPEWGNVHSFSLPDSELQEYMRDGNTYRVFHDPGAPPTLSHDSIVGLLPEEYQWGFTMVAIWSNHLDPFDDVMWDISPNNIGNIDFGDLPRDIEGYRQFYDDIEGGDISKGRSINPITDEPYEVQLVPRGDYSRVLAEFWADGPDSETPPGHWFTIMNDVFDDPDFEYKFRGTKDMDTLEYEVKAYFTLGGAMHDCAIAAWSVKGWYDYVRPVSVLRYMGDKGQRSDPNLPRYHPHGFELIPDLIELVGEDDPLALEDTTAIGAIKLNGWRGHDFVENPRIDMAGVDWFLVRDFWPYQRVSFVTPPFAGFVSGHSTFSRGAAEVLTLLTGDEYFPGGIGTYHIEKNEFLEFEEGPSVSFELQWATYRDASDQTSLSRIWGGIHPPADDIPGRIMGAAIGVDAFDHAVTYFNESSTPTTDIEIAANRSYSLFPNPLAIGEKLIIESKTNSYFDQVNIFNIRGQQVLKQDFDLAVRAEINLPASWRSGTYIVEVRGQKGSEWKKIVILHK